jgi:hypothetical protein
MKFSIIIPHFNVPDLLERAINSIPNRQDTEIIVVDDSSSEENKLKLRTVCKESSKLVRLLEQPKNMGGGAARNAGMDIAIGDFLLFLDADDFFNECINDIMNEYANDEKHDVIFFKASSVDNVTLEPRDRLNYLNDQIDKWIANPQRGEIELRYSFGVPVCKLIRRGVVVENHLRFDETRIHNDTTFAYRLGYVANQIFADARFGYCATIREGSVSRQESDELRLVTINILGRAVLFFREKLHISHMEDQLSFNLYILLRKRSYKYFIKGIDELVKIGFSRDDIFSFFSRQMALDSLKSTIWVILFSPIFKIKILSLKGIFRYTIISCFKNKKHCIHYYDENK